MKRDAVERAWKYDDLSRESKPRSGLSLLGIPIRRNKPTAVLVHQDHLARENSDHAKRAAHDTATRLPSRCATAAHLVAMQAPAKAQRDTAWPACCAARKRRRRTALVDHHGRGGTHVAVVAGATPPGSETCRWRSRSRLASGQRGAGRRGLSQAEGMGVVGRYHTMPMAVGTACVCLGAAAAGCGRRDDSRRVAVAFGTNVRVWWCCARVQPCGEWLTECFLGCDVSSFVSTALASLTWPKQGCIDLLIPMKP